MLPVCTRFLIILFKELTAHNSIKKPGRQRQIIDEKEVKSLLRLSFTWKKIVELIGDSVVSLRSNLKDFSDNAVAYKEIADAQLME